MAPSRLRALRQAAQTHRLPAYLVIGGLSYVIDAGLLYLLSTRLGVVLWAAASVGFWTSVVANFGLNHLLFRSVTGGPVHLHALRYGALLLVNFAFTLLLLEAGAALGVPVLVTKTVAVGVTTCWNFVLYRTWVFR